MTQVETLIRDLKTCNESKAKFGDLIMQQENELYDYRTELSKEMPLDFKDWWENNKKEWPIVARCVLEMRRKNIERLEAENERLRKNYEELIYAVSKKFSGETRHQTALRYITEREDSVSHCTSQAKAALEVDGEKD